MTYTAEMHTVGDVPMLILTGPRGRLDLSQGQCAAIAAVAEMHRTLEKQGRPLAHGADESASPYHRLRDEVLAPLLGFPDGCQEGVLVGEVRKVIADRECLRAKLEEADDARMKWRDEAQRSKADLAAATERAEKAEALAEMRLKGYNDLEATYIQSIKGHGAQVSSARTEAAHWKERAEKAEAELAEIESAIPDEGDETNARVVEKAFKDVERLSHDYDATRAEADAAKAEVAALKARKVTLPQRFAIDAVEGHDRSGYPEAQLEIEASASGPWIHYSETADAIRAAGVEVAE